MAGWVRNQINEMLRASAEEILLILTIFRPCFCINGMRSIPFHYFSPRIVLFWEVAKSYGIRGGEHGSFGCNRVNFLHSSCNVTVFCICTDTGLIIQGYFSHLRSRVHRPPRPFFSHSLPPTGGLEGAQGVGKRHSWDSWLRLTTGIFLTTGYHAQHIVLREAGGHLGWYHLSSSQVTVTHDKAQLSWEWFNTCLPMGNSQWIPCLASLVCMIFAFFIKLCSSQPTSFLTVYSLNVSPITSREGGGRVSTCMRLHFQLGLKHKWEFFRDLWISNIVHFVFPCSWSI